MKNKIISLSIFVIFLSSCAQNINYSNVLNQVGQVLNSGSLTEGEVGLGLKEALTQGISIGADKASLTDGFFGNSLIKIPFPPEVQKVENTLRSIGLGDQVDKFVLSLNRGAEQAAVQAKPIFISAIKQLTIKDAFSILSGNKDAATQYLKRTTTQSLITAFQPIMSKTLGENNTTKYYSQLANVYNQIPMVTKVNADLESYATQKAIDGLFVLVAQEELKIREDPIARTTDLLKRVFGSKQ